MSTLGLLGNDASNSVLIENNEWGFNPFPSNSIVFNENIIVSVVAALTLTLDVNGPLRFVYIHSQSSLVFTLNSDKD